jgi:hypothetical protein
MDAHKPDALTDAPLEREVEALLDIEPSAHFLARVRARVAEEPAPSPWRFRWTFAGTAAAVASIAMAVIWLSFEPARSIDAPYAALVAEDVTSVGSKGGRLAMTAPASEAVRRSSEVLRPRRAIATPERRDLVAVVAPEDIKAFENLLASIRKPDVLLVLNDDTVGPVALSIPGIEIAPINIEPVPPVAQPEGGLE